MALTTGRRIPIPLLPPLVVRYIEGPIARRLMNVNTHGVTESGVEEWYRCSGLRWVRLGSASLDGIDLGSIVPLVPVTGWR